MDERNIALRSGKSMFSRNGSKRPGAPDGRHIWWMTVLIVFGTGLTACHGGGYKWSPLTSAPAEPPAYPIKISGNRRYFVDRKGAPFLVHGDAAWSLISGLTKPEADAYLEDRRRKGFNAVIVNLIEHKFKGPKNRDGEPPFTVPGDFAKPNEKYFAHADWVIRKAGEKGILVILAPCYLGSKGGDEGWYDEMLANGVEKSGRYGSYVASRYKNFDNIAWLLSGDRNPEQAMPHLEAMAEAIREADGRHLRTAELDRGVSTRDVFSGDAWVDFNATYTDGLVYARALRDYNRTPIMPTILLESYYEGEHGSTAQWIRRQAYWALLNGAAGQVMGNRPTWLFDPGWQTALNSSGSQSMVHLKTLFLSRPWYKIVPDSGMVSDGVGEPGGYDYVAAARAADGTAAIVYLPTARTIKVNLSRISGSQAKAFWFDPRTGQVAAAGVFDTKRPVQFLPPDDGDWVLLLDRVAKSASADSH
jgi:hypothetical protein